MYRLHEEIELRAWRMLLNKHIFWDTYCRIVDWSNVNFRMWLSNDTL